jgi:mRNA-degrading endonuclease RelE of RelBE toxin-antitoxin system
MSFNVIASPRFRKELKALSKKYPSLKFEYADLVSSLEENPQQGTPLGNNCFKIRIAIASKNRGKSGGGRVITYFVSEDEIVYLLSIYDKSDQDSISSEDIQILIQRIQD